MPTNVINSQFHAPNKTTGDQELHHFETELEQVADMAPYMRTLNNAATSPTRARQYLGAAGVGNSNFPFMRKNNTQYQVGDIAYSEYLPSYLRLECVQAGISGDSEPIYDTPDEE